MPSADKVHNDIFKTGLIVADIGKAMEDLGRWMQIEWTPPSITELTIRTDDGDDTVALTFACSTNTTTILELLQAHERGYYQLQPGEKLHHVSIWAEDLAATSERLAAQGMPLEAIGVGDEGAPSLFAFHKNPYGLRVELVDAAMRPQFMQWLAGGELGL